jgi:hypothetical protein
MKEGSKEGYRFRSQHLTSIGRQILREQIVGVIDDHEMLNYVFYKNWSAETFRRKTRFGVTH